MYLEEMLEFNKKFVTDKQYIQYETDSVPNKRMVIFTCMESRLVELLPRALNIQNGDVKMLKNAGAIIRKPFDSIMKSILVAVYELQADQVIVIGHHDCGMSHVDTSHLRKKMTETGVQEDLLQTLEYAGLDFHEEFHGFDTVEESIQQSANIIRNHPLLPKYVKVHRLISDPGTGKVDVVSQDNT